MLINVKMPTAIVGILTFMSRIKFVISRVEHEKEFQLPRGLVSDNRFSDEETVCLQLTI